MSSSRLDRTRRASGSPVCTRIPAAASSMSTNWTETGALLAELAERFPGRRGRRSGRRHRRSGAAGVRAESILGAARCAAWRSLAKRFPAYRVLDGARPVSGGAGGGAGRARDPTEGQGRRPLRGHRDRHELLDPPGAVRGASRYPQSDPPRGAADSSASMSSARSARAPISWARTAGCPDSREGDVLLIANCGAYGYAMASNYNRRPPAAEFMIRIMKQVGIIGWRGMVGSVLLESMRAGEGLRSVRSRPFSAPRRPDAAAPEGGRSRRPKCTMRMTSRRSRGCPCSSAPRAATTRRPSTPVCGQPGWQGYWIDAASTLRMAKKCGDRARSGEPRR